MGRSAINNYTRTTGGYLGSPGQTEWVSFQHIRVTGEGQEGKPWEVRSVQSWNCSCWAWAWWVEEEGSVVKVTVVNAFGALALYQACAKPFPHTILFKLPSSYWRRQWQATPVLLPRKSHGWRSLVGYSPRGRYESVVTERLHFHFSLSCNGEGNGNPLQCCCLENPRDGVAWWAAVYGVTQSRTRLKRLSSSSSSYYWYPWFSDKGAEESQGAIVSYPGWHRGEVESQGLHSGLKKPHCTVLSEH